MTRLDNVCRIGYRVHHTGYLTPDIAKSQAAFSRLGFEAQTAEYIYDPDRVCYFLFMVNGESRVELVSPKDDTSPIWNLSKKYKNIPYHVCYETPDLEAAIADLTRRDLSRGGGNIYIISKTCQSDRDIADGARSFSQLRRHRHDRARPALLI